MKVAELIIRPPFSELFPINNETLDMITKSMMNTGFNTGFPVHVWDSPDGLVLIDGHTRVKAALTCNIEDVPIHTLQFNNEKQAVKYACMAQRDRRNLSREEMAKYLLAAVEYFDNRKKRGGDHKSEEAKSKTSLEVFDPICTAQELADSVGVSKTQVERARVVLDTGNDEIKGAVESGEMSLTYAANIIREQKKEEKLAVSGKFNRVNDNIEWAQWSWNPVTGCNYGCEYCYARDIANRFFEEKFEPTFHPERLSAPDNTKPIDGPGGNCVFVCSMADLFGSWVPNEWIFSVLEQVEKHPEWTFIFLTKNPERLKVFDFPENAWVGSTVDTQARADAATKHMPDVRASTIFLSCEPLLEEVKFNDLSWCNWVIIGGRSKNTQGAESQPEWSWVYNLTKVAYDSNCKVYWKPNLTVRPKEHP